ncbi:peptidase [Rhizobium rhizosphaerae]|uniref:Peptidase n=2 Tax=Xaviernesmea rhizosphaerae TaxID=1672749 RepID=A0ABX3PBM8_9HYPH|nr:peptidase [Xaviernesmea rhizosphaerae]
MKILMTVSRFCLILSAVPAVLVPIAQPWAAEREVVKTYAITGKTGAELYASIGDRGPVLGHGQRVIAHTSFKLTWKRDYREEAGGCRLAGTIPSLVITYTLPKPSGALSPAMAESWKRFSDGVRRHEIEHGRFIREMVAEIEAASLGLAATPDPGCRQVRQMLNARLKAISDRNTARNAAYDRVEMSEGGAVHQLILALVNGP